MDNSNIYKAAKAILEADSILITAGAGMGVDSGLPDFRGERGFWKAYPAYEKLGLDFVDMANPKWFDNNPSLAFGFYGHRAQLYNATKPHAGFNTLKKWSKEKKSYFVFTSNVDGHFQKSGFSADKVVECHGSINRWQCLDKCGENQFPINVQNLNINSKTFLADGEFPRCPRCNALARPNILMFGDADWDNSFYMSQMNNFDKWLSSNTISKLVVVECGAGNAIPTIRNFGESLQRVGATLIRINPRDTEASRETIVLKEGTLSALKKIEKILE